MQQKDVVVGGMKFTFTQLSKFGFSVRPRPWREFFNKKHFIIQTVHSTFNKELFSFAHSPLCASEVINRDKFSRRNDIRVLDCPIKFPYSDEYRIPRDLLQFEEVISKIVSFEHSINPKIDQYFAYLTVDQGFVSDGTTQRNQGCHVDGFQGARHPNKNPINRSYIVYDCLPTVFHAQSFNVAHLKEEYNDFFLEFDEQANPSSEMFFDPYSILLMNAYTVHKAQISNKLTYRTFFRLSFDVNMFDRLGNTHNPLFDYHWPMVMRHTRKQLRHKTNKIVAL